MIILPCPIRPDLDCVAGSVAYAEYLERTQGKEARAWICGKPDGEAQFYLDLFSEQVALANDAAAAQAQSYILVDFSTKICLPDSVDTKKVAEVIDHRFFNAPDVDFPNARIQLDPVGAAATQIAEFYHAAGIAPSPHSAAMLYGAIYSNTLCFDKEYAVERDLKAAEWLLEVEPSSNAYIEKQLQVRKESIENHMPDILQDEMKIVQGRFGSYGFSQLELMGGKDFWSRNQNAIKNFASQLSMPFLLNIVDLKLHKSILFSNKDEFKSTLKHNYQTTESEDALVLDKVQLRKTLTPLFK